MAVGPTRGKRRLARYLKPMLDESGLKPDDIAGRVRTSRQTINRMLNGTALPRWPVVLAVLGLIGATKEQQTEVLRLWEIADVPTSTIQHAELLPPKYRRFRVDEREAGVERTLDTTSIPGLLQTAGYAEAHARSAWRRTGGEWSEAAAAERRDRQALLVQPADPLRLYAVMDEAAIRRRVGGSKVMRDQLDHLLAEIEGGTQIQVIPFDIGAYGSITGSLVLLSYDDADRPELAYMQGPVGLEPIDEDRDVQVLYDLWSDAAAAALDVAQTVALINRVKDGI